MTVDTIDYRLRAHVPFMTGSPRGVLPVPLLFSYRMARYGIPVLEITYAEGTTRAEWLDEPVEISLQVKDADGTWREPDNCRFIRTTITRDRVDKTRVRRYTCLGLGFLLTRLKIWDAEEADPGDGPTAPVRNFSSPDAGNLLVPTWNAAIARAFTDLDVPFTSPPHKTYELDVDSNDVPWAEFITGHVSRRPQEPLSNLVDLCIQTGIAEPAWHNRDFNLYNFGTYGTDRTATVILRDAHGVSSSPETKDWQDIAARVLVVGSEGQMYIRENEDADLSYGSLEHATSISGLSDPDALHKAARELIRLGESENEQLSREGTNAAAGPKPLRDYHVGDIIKVQRDGAQGSRTPSLDVVELGFTRRQGRKIEWYVKLGDRHEDRLMRSIRRSGMMTAGEVVSSGGRPGDPGTDVRRPAAPTNVQVVVTTEADATNKTIGKQVITWDAVTLDTDGNPINLDGYEIGEKRFGIIAQIARVNAGQLQWDRADVRVGGRDIEVRAVSHAFQRSLWSADIDGSVVRDAEPADGLNKVVDARYVNPDIRTKRAANAGAGFAFATSSSRMRAQFTTTTPVLRSRIAGTSDGGWIPVEVGQKWLVGGTHRRVGGTTASARYGVTWRDAAGSSTEVANVVTTVTTTSDVRSVGEWTVPSGAVEASWRVTGVTFTGSPTLEVIDPIFERRTSNERLEDASVTGGAAGAGVKIAATTITNANIVANTIRANEIAAHTITAGEIAAGTITANELAADSVTASEITSDAIDGMTINGATMNSATISAISVTSGSLSTIFMNLSGTTIDVPIGAGTLAGDWDCTGDFTAVSVTETSARKGKADLRKLLDPRRLLKVPTFTYRKARDTGARRQVGIMAEDLADAGLEELIVRDDDGKPARVAYSRVVTVLLDIVREQDRRIERLEGGA